MPLFLHGGAIHHFAHIPKAGGSSIRLFVEKRLGTPFLVDTTYWNDPPQARWSRSSPQHLLWEDLVRMVPREIVASVFAVTRHPVTRAASAYNYRVSRQEVCVGDGFESWFERGLAVRGRGGYVFDNHIEPQHRFVPPEAETWRLEDGLDAALAALARRFGVEPIAQAAVANRTPTDRSAAGGGHAGRCRAARSTGWSSSTGRISSASATIPFRKARSCSRSRDGRARPRACVRGPSV